MHTRSLIADEAGAFVDRDYDRLTQDDLPGMLWERARALKVLGTESDSFVRLGAGLVAWLSAVLGGAGLALAVWDAAPVAVRVLGLVVGGALLAAGAVLGRRVWKAGRRVVDAFVWWTLLPERMHGGGVGVDDWRAAPVRDAVQARVFVFQGWRPLRIVLGTLSFFAPLAYASELEFRAGSDPWVAGQTASLWVFGVVVAATGVIGGVVVMGGQVRANNAHSQRDPVRRRLLGR